MGRAKAAQLREAEFQGPGRSNHALGRIGLGGSLAGYIHGFRLRGLGFRDVGIAAFVFAFWVSWFWGFRWVGIRISVLEGLRFGMLLPVGLHSFCSV